MAGMEPMDTSYGLSYPLWCESARDLRRIQSKIFDMLSNNVNVHFLYQNHTTRNCSPFFYETLFGKNPQRKIIIISPNDPDLELEVAALVTVFVRQFQNLGRGVGVGDRQCPYCQQE